MDRDPLARRRPGPGSGRSEAGRSSAARRGEGEGRRRDAFRGGRRTIPGLDSFWLEADRESSAQDPLERELAHRLDAMARYGRLIEAALAEGHDRAAELLVRQREREESEVRRLRGAMRRGSRGGR